MSQCAMNFLYTRWKEMCWFQRFFRKDKMSSSVSTWHYSGLYPPPFRLPYIKKCAKTNKEYTYKYTKRLCVSLCIYKEGKEPTYQHTFTVGGLTSMTHTFCWEGSRLRTLWKGVHFQSQEVQLLAAQLAQVIDHMNWVNGNLH